MMKLFVPKLTKLLMSTRTTWRTAAKGMLVQMVKKHLETKDSLRLFKPRQRPPLVHSLGRIRRSSGSNNDR